MKKRGSVQPFAPMRTAPSAVAELDADERAQLAAATRARQDAVRAAETAALRARLAVAETAEVEIALMRALGAKYGFDPDRAWLLTEDGRLVPAPPAQG